MAGAKEFGRRQAPPGPSKPQAPPPVPCDPLVLSPDAERFRQSVGSAFRRKPDEFQLWWRTQTTHRLLLWLLNVTLIAPGLLCAALGLGAAASGIVEILGVALAIWVRRERRRRLQAIAQWSGGSSVEDLGAPHADPASP